MVCESHTTGNEKNHCTLSKRVTNISNHLIKVDTYGGRTLVAEANFVKEYIHFLCYLGAIFLSTQPLLAKLNAKNPQYERSGYNKALGVLGQNFSE